LDFLLPAFEGSWRLVLVGERARGRWSTTLCSVELVELCRHVVVDLPLSLRSLPILRGWHGVAGSGPLVVDLLEIKFGASRATSRSWAADASARACSASASFVAEDDPDQAAANPPSERWSATGPGFEGAARAAPGTRTRPPSAGRWPGSVPSAELTSLPSTTAQIRHIETEAVMPAFIRVLLVIFRTIQS
jgi:hypothetical protein